MLITLKTITMTSLKIKAITIRVFKIRRRNDNDNVDHEIYIVYIAKIDISKSKR